MGHVRVSHPAGRHEVVPICSRQIGRRASRYDPFGTLSLITGFVSSLKGALRPLLFLLAHQLFAVFKQRFQQRSLFFIAFVQVIQ
ncbi:hypothetical protein SerAS12_3354 [Serratia sp. AS12]|nr:hypothetical protein SerAS9_3353 [Serratia plymuthica AS9]AEF51415.1 hypothetical protein SerAS12_3354 [Serratia sp. AS12]AEG29123.1 hypothetical protein SerAS13_3356 [Serratia sp. AS13]